VVKKGPLLEKFQSVRLTREGAEGFLFDGFPLGFKVFEYHSDVVSVLPEGASVLARNRDAVQAFAVREMFGVQFHPEITPSLARKLAVQDGEDPREVLNSVRDDYFLPLDVLKNFAAYCEVSAGR
jgi:GMP synthase-like glutamine amidotransferase